MALIDVLRSLAINPRQSPGSDAQEMMNMYSQPNPQFSQPQPQGLSQMAPMAQIPSFAPPQQQAPQMPQQMTQPQGGGFKEFLLQLGLPLLSTGVGLASPRMLPGAAGFNQAYSPAFQGARKNQQEYGLEEAKLKEKKKEKEDKEKPRPAVTYDPDSQKFFDSNGKEIKDIPYNAVIRNKTSGQTVDAMARFMEMMGGNPVEDAQQQTEDINSEDEMITVKFNDGKTMDMTSSEARSKGYIK